ncbi:GNAT family N-acetyltransferase [Fredinandcohnia humi]
MTVTLQPITNDNWKECIQLKVSKEQQSFVASNLYSNAEVQFLPNFEALAIYADEVMVGFVMFGLDADDNNYWIYRLMVDEKYQGKGFGKKALQLAVQRMIEKPDCMEIIIGYQPENLGAEKTYLGVGFQPKELAPWGEKLVHIVVR